MDRLKLWFQKKSATTHAVWIGLVAFAVYFNSSADFREQVGQIFVGHPVIFTKVSLFCSNLVIALTIWAKVSKANKKLPDADPASPDNLDATQPDSK
jgi:hypothetical protein